MNEFKDPGGCLAEVISRPNPNDRDKVEMREYKSAFLQ
jgi:hypothetical protein